MFGTHPVELGLKEGDGFPERLQSADARYAGWFRAAFPGEAEPATVKNVARAVACFERTIIGGGSRWDRYHYARDDGAISEAAKRGEVLFFSRPLSCFRCHGGFGFGGGAEYHNTGLYNVAGRYSYPEPNLGIFEFTRDPADVGKFKAPTLRNVAVTGPYMHDGSVATLEEAIDHYAAGGRGRGNPNKDPLVGGFRITAEERADLVEFLKSLTDETVLRDARFGDPWAGEKGRY